MTRNKLIKLATCIILTIFFATSYATSEMLFPDKKGGAWGPSGYYSPDTKGGLWGPDGNHYYGIEDAQRQLGEQQREERRKQEEERKRQKQVDEMNKNSAYSPKKRATKSPPSREQIINRAWKKSGAYRRFKMGTISKIEGRSEEDHNKWVKYKEEKAKRRWVEKCNGRGCWSEPVVATKNINTDMPDVYERKMDKMREQNINWLYNKNKGDGKPANPAPIRKKKVNGVWRFSNTE